MNQSGAERRNSKHIGTYSIEDSGEWKEADNPYMSGLGYFQEHEDIADNGEHKSKYQQEELRLLAHVGALDDLYLDVLSPPFQAFGDDVSLFQKSQFIESDEERSYALPSASLEILKGCRNRLATVNGRKINWLHNDSEQWPAYSSPLSANQILELAAGNFIESKSASSNEMSAISHPYASSIVCLSTENARDVQLVQDLLLCAEKVGDHQYYCGTKLLEECHRMSSSRTSTIQRLVHYFSEALHEKIDRETGKYAEKIQLSLDTVTPNSGLFKLLMKFPVALVSQFTCIQTMLENVPLSGKIHIIDIEIRCGAKLIILMQSLASRSERPLKHLKVSAVATKSKLLVEEACARLRNMAESLKINLSFRVIMLDDIINNRPKLFDLDAEEAIIVHAAHVLQEMIPRPSQLEVLIRAIKRINPHLMIVTESEANTNSSIFANRFIEALVFYGAYFDSMEDCLKNDAADRTLAESSLFRPAIRSIVGAKDENRTIQSVGINIWREFFSKFGMEETQLSKSALNHANLIRASVNCGNSCTLCLNGNSLIVGWKGTPICSVSVWKFHGRWPIKPSQN